MEKLQPNYINPFVKKKYKRPVIIKQCANSPMFMLATRKPIEVGPPSIKLQQFQKQWQNPLNFQDVYQDIAKTQVQEELLIELELNERPLVVKGKRVKGPLELNQ